MTSHVCLPPTLAGAEDCKDLKIAKIPPRGHVASPEVCTKRKMLLPGFFYCTAIIDELGGRRGTAGLIINENRQADGAGGGCFYPTPPLLQPKQAHVASLSSINCAGGTTVRELTTCLHHTYTCSSTRANRRSGGTKLPHFGPNISI